MEGQRLARFPCRKCSRESIIVYQGELPKQIVPNDSLLCDHCNQKHSYWGLKHSRLLYESFRFKCPKCEKWSAISTYNIGLVIDKETGDNALRIPDAVRCEHCDVESPV